MPRTERARSEPTRDDALTGNAQVVNTDEVEAKDPLSEADSDMRNVLIEMDALGVKPIATLSVEQARSQKTPADAVRSLLKKENKAAAPLEMAKVSDRKIGTNAARIYTPKAANKGPLPVIVYFHGGGWVIADLATYDASARALANGAKAIVVSAEYRHAPEHKFPAAHDDALAAYEWTIKNAASFGGDPKRIALAGESAGGNLALNVAIAARDKGLARPIHQLLIYPVAQAEMNTHSYLEWANAKPLDRQAMAWFVDKALPSASDKADKRITLVDANLKNLAPTTIILAEIDPLRSDGELLADRLDDSGVEVERKVYDGVTHEFFGLGAYVADAKDAQDYAGEQLRDAFEEVAAEDDATNAKRQSPKPAVSASSSAK
jgi:acetyl esterase/lipase